MTGLTSAELSLLATAAAAAKGVKVRVVTREAAYSCCGRGWRIRKGYEQTYHGWIDEYDPQTGTFRLVSPGIGTVSYMIRANTIDVELIEQLL